MADPISYGNPDRDTEQALIALKKGTQLIKYSRKGKPKFCPFRISRDETTLIWYSHKKERAIKLASVIRITLGQRTAVFRRFPRPEKDYLSFSLIYNNGERSLDLICKDQAEVEVWLAGLRALISTGQHRHSRGDSQSDGILFSDDSGEYCRPYGASIDSTLSISRSLNTNFYTCEPSWSLRRSDVGSDRANMQLRSSNADNVRLSISSAPSSSSQGSGPDDIESLGDVYVWGEIWSDGIVLDGSTNSPSSRTDVLLPKPLESNVVLDVHQIACGVRHVALVTRQGEVFSWGEESGGQLGHGNDKDVSRPRLVESLAVWNMDYVACGEYHTCAISTAGDLFTWGDGAYNTGLLGHGTNISHWIPKRVSGNLEGVQVLFVACGTWHSALITSNGKVFTFGDGTFGVLGHGDRESVAYPKEVESLSGLRTIKVACGVWHTAAIVEVMGQVGVNVISRKLFTWGDGDKYRLGHGDKEARLVPTCVSSLIDYNFHQLACGHNITVALTTSGHVFTMGSTSHGQLGNPQSDGKLPRLVQDRLIGELVEEISCGAHHVAILTSRSEVYTWGKGANGRLGHGDVEDRKTPTFIEALKDRHVKSISCGSNFTACICIHKWVSGSDQSVCSGCRQAFGFTRKRHNCYNCGLVHCHACSSKKVLKAALAPTPGKPHRVCDSCYSKIKAAEAGNAATFVKKITTPRQSIDGRERSDRGEIRSSKILVAPHAEAVKYAAVKNEIKSDSQSGNRASQVPSLLQLKDIAFPSSLTALQTALKPIVTSAPPPASTYTMKPSPPHSTTPVFSRSVIDSLKKTNELLNQEVLKLQTQVKNLKEKCEIHDVVLKKSEKKAEEAAFLAAEEAARCNAAVEVIKSLDIQLKEIAEKLPLEVSDNILVMHTQVESFLKTSENGSKVSSSLVIDSSENDQPHLTNEGTSDIHDQKIENVRDDLEFSQNAVDGDGQNDGKSAVAASGEATAHHSIENDPKAESTEQFEPGVYVTFVQSWDGTKLFKRVRFSKRRFAEQQAGDWWNRNKERVFEKYNHPVQGAPPTLPASAPPAEEEDAAPSSES
ncbi:PH, RCC1 and FYVE domains-containing protein 1 isoform X1 [Elaeis guineensis]|uniref:PH, RCC1 and FYVE domains-containing protein 1 n=1 Tax=Elaeis guineensis var. tenera TaxID=51953 RepID=A0A6J0PQ72_ELAGV|nr:PH, RCC1 and FYVE domains-containing protein 1 [Elaeis guineensis]XP_019709845.1 PH, RCC1 and FYVE domains-containing protein 1 [Elaeis guineensis]XP_019709846.1 PH, RCC1 and FYVE domains-containing protein 1 [Elaeis guineensis]